MYSPAANPFRFMAAMSDIADKLAAVAAANLPAVTPRLFQQLWLALYIRSLEDR